MAARFLGLKVACSGDWFVSLGAWLEVAFVGNWIGWLAWVLRVSSLIVGMQ